jgi:hypothetical protein
MILKPYSPQDRSQMYLLALAHELIKNRPIKHGTWKGDYLLDVSAILTHIFNIY